MNYKELSNVFKKINKWYEKRIKVLSIKTRPFNTIEILSNIVKKNILDNKNIVYIFCSDEKQYIKEKQNELYRFINQDIVYKEVEKNLDCISIDEIKDLNKTYDLVIFDDISLFSKVRGESIRDAVEEVYWKSNKIIIYSSEFIFPIGERIYIPYLLEQKPIIEPRLITTRIKLEKDIPLALFEYFKWFKENKKKVLIIVPSEEKLDKVYNHYYEVLKSINIRVIRYNKGQDFKFIKYIINENNESLFIVTNNCGQYINEVSDANIVLLFSDDIYYSYKKIIYICAAINNTTKSTSELIMVSRDVSEHMDKAKNMTRELNRRLWEKRY